MLNPDSGKPMCGGKRSFQDFPDDSKLIPICVPMKKGDNKKIVSLYAIILSVVSAVSD